MLYFQVAHMDLKPQNLLLTGSKKEPRIKVQFLFVCLQF